MYYTSIKKNL